MYELKKAHRKAIGAFGAVMATLILIGPSCPTNEDPAGTPVEGSSEVDGNDTEANLSDQAVTDITGKPFGSSAATNTAPPVTAPKPVEMPHFFTMPPKATFVHVQPGVKSEVYVDFKTGTFADRPDAGDPNAPPDMIDVEMNGPGIIGEHHQLLPLQQNHPFHVIFPINRFGAYEGSVDILTDGEEASSTPFSVNVK